MIHQTKVTFHNSPLGTLVLQMPVTHDAKKKQMLIHKLIMNSPNFEDVYVYNTMTGASGYCAEDFTTTPKEIIANAVFASVNPMTSSLVIGINNDQWKDIKQYIITEEDYL